MTPGQRIKELRIDNEIAQETLATELGYKTYTTISKWEADKSLPPGRELKKLAEYFEVSVDYILGLDDYVNKGSISQIADTVELVFFETISQGLIDKNPAVSNQKISVPRMSLKEDESHYFSIKVRTDSLNRIIPSGHSVVVLDFSVADDTSLNTGDIIVVFINSDFRLVRFRKTDSLVYLEPSSYVNGFQTIELSNEEFNNLEIVGKVILSFIGFE